MLRHATESVRNTAGNTVVMLVTPAWEGMLQALFVRLLMLRSMRGRLTCLRRGASRKADMSRAGCPANGSPGGPARLKTYAVKERLLPAQGSCCALCAHRACA
jgi:hypothetical protein